MAEVGGEVEVVRCGGIDCRPAAFCAAERDGEGRFAWDNDNGRVNGVVLIGVDGFAPR